MGIFSRHKDVDIKVDETSFNSWKGVISNEIAGTKSMEKSYAKELPSVAEVVANTKAADRYVVEVAEQLYYDRPKSGRRSVQPDGHGHGRVPLFARSGIWSARQDPERWPEQTQPRYEPRPYAAPPGSGGRPGRDGCPGCPQC